MQVLSRVPVSDEKNARYAIIGSDIQEPKNFFGIAEIKSKE